MSEKLYLCLRMILEEGGVVLFHELCPEMYEDLLINGGLDYVDYVFDHYYNCNIQLNEKALMLMFRYENAKYLS